VLRDVTDRFEEVWYGGAEVDAAAYASFATATASVRQVVGEPALEPAGLQEVGP